MTGGSFPSVTPDQMSHVDRIMTLELGVDVLQLMELAGQAVAVWARERFWQGAVRGNHVSVLAGSGGNGGDGMVAARLLHAWGAEVTVWLSHDAQTLQGAAAHQVRSLTALGLPLLQPIADDSPFVLPAADLIIRWPAGVRSAGSAHRRRRAADRRGQPSPGPDSGYRSPLWPQCFDRSAVRSLHSRRRNPDPGPPQNGPPRSCRPALCGRPRGGRHRHPTHRLRPPRRGRRHGVQRTKHCAGDGETASRQGREKPIADSR